MEIKYIEWCEPFDSEAKYNLICRMDIQEVIKWQMNRKDLKEKGHKYKEELDALLDFMVVHWAVFV